MCPTCLAYFHVSEVHAQKHVLKTAARSVKKSSFYFILKCRSWRGPVRPVIPVRGVNVVSIGSHLYPKYMLLTVLFSSMDQNQSINIFCKPRSSKKFILARNCDVFPTTSHWSHWSHRSHRSSPAFTLMSHERRMKFEPTFHLVTPCN